MRHEDRVVLVTGATGGIGSALVERYLREGARVGLVDLDDARGQAAVQAWRQQGHAVSFAAADVSRYDACAAAVEQIRAELGEIDTLVNNAGISPKHDGAPSPVQAMDALEWDRVVGVNLNSAFYLTRLLAPGMIARGFGRIVSMSSVAGKVAISSIVGAHYSATKAALIGFTRHAAAELGPHGITVNALAPGRISTPLLSTVADAANQAVIRETALRRLGKPSEVADVCAFLTSNEAAFVTGQVVDVAGGWLMT
ncbi:SDR family oxidoreductase [Castellaniella caeni]|uniref:SDR family oxidoreductase n=1 Tax=Castellaniella caeni TaxID=266123 RepID=UPI00082C1E1B|nr:SDR family NAD(P)-dependent oxidoreductase [Castellaniella caeni]